MNREKEIIVLLMSLVPKDQLDYAMELLNKLVLSERNLGYALYGRLCARVANLTFNKHDKEYPSNVLDYIQALSYGGTVLDGWKPNPQAHKQLRDFYSEIKAKRDRSL